MKLKNEEEYLDRMEEILALYDTYKEHATLEEQKIEYPKFILMLDKLKEDYFNEIDNVFTNKIRRFFGLSSKIPTGKFNSVLVGLMMLLMAANEEVGN